jgi:chromosome segregation ATPase
MPTSEKQFDRLLNVVLETQADVKELKTDFGGLKTDVKGLKTDVGGLNEHTGRLEAAQDRLLVVTLDTQVDVKELKHRTARLEESHERTFSRLDDFLTILRRHDDEVMATRNTCDRLSQRVERLEKRNV